MNAPHLDLTVPSVPAARHLAHLECLAHGPEAAKALMAKLLLQVDETDGGLLGADDWRVSVVRRRFGITVDQYVEALYSPGNWPVSNEQVAA
jgi:hypothetical protein